MRIAIITPGFSASETDWCIPVLLNIVQGLAQQHDISVFSLRYPHTNATYVVYGARVRSLGGRQAAGLARLPLLFRGLRNIMASSKRGPFDLIHGFWGDEPGYLAIMAARRLGIPSVVSVMGGEIVGYPSLGYGGQLSLFNRWLVRQALAEASVVTAGSIYLCEILKKFSPGRQVVLLPLGVNTHIFRAPRVPKTPSSKGIQILNVASLTPVKDHSSLLTAIKWSRSHHPDLHLHFVGDGPLRRNIEQQIDMLDLDEHVTLHGAVPHELIPGHYQRADLCVQSSRFESQGMVVLEAAACGTLTIGTRVGILPEMTPQEYLSPPGDIKGLANNLIAALENPEGLRQAARRTQSRVASELTLAHTIHQFEGLYRSLLGRSASAPYLSEDSPGELPQS